MQGKISGSLGALRGFGQTLRQQEGQPSLADLARKAGKGVEQTGEPVTVERTQTKGNVGPAPPRRHPRDPNLVWDTAARRWKPAKDALSMSGRPASPPAKKR